jgi:exo-beta-1,3-glucanase (GH17 family)
MGQKGIYLNLVGVDVHNKDRHELVSIFKEILNSGIHGIGFSAYGNDQKPGDQLSIDLIEERMRIIKPYVKWVRSFSCTEGNEEIPRIAHEMGIKTMVGAWLGTDKEKNENEIQNVIKVAKAGHADIVAVGNEVLLREDLTLEDLISQIKRVKDELPDIPVSYVDSYYVFDKNPELVDAIDVLLINCYPFWEGCSLDYSPLYLKGMYSIAEKCAKGKKIIISETGWPNKGTPVWGAEPSYNAALKYFISTCKWAEEEKIEYFYFASFDEGWKIAAEGDVGAYWGLWDKDHNLKYDHNSLNFFDDK